MPETIFDIFKKLNENSFPGSFSAIFEKKEYCLAFGIYVFKIIEYTNLDDKKSLFDLFYEEEPGCNIPLGYGGLTNIELIAEIGKFVEYSSNKRENKAL